MERIFDPYFTTKHGGTGLGLTTARLIILRHGGAIDVVGNNGGGTTFVVYVPAQAGAHVAAEGAEKICAPRVEATGMYWSWMTSSRCGR